MAGCSCPRPEAAIPLISAYLRWWEDLGLIDEELDRLVAALGAADPARIPLDVLDNALGLASTAATYLGRVDEAAAFVDQLAVLLDQHPDKPNFRAGWAFAMATPTRYRAGGDRSEANRLMREAQDAAEVGGMPIWAAYAAGNIVLAAIPWDAADDPEVARALRDSTALAQTADFPNVAVVMRVFDGIIRVMGGANDAYPSCLDAFADLDALDGGWLAEWSGICLGMAAELVGDHPVAAAHALRWVRFCRRSGVRMMLTCGIRGAARLSATVGDSGESLRLWAGAESIESVTGMGYTPLMERLDRPLRRQCTDALGPDATRLLAEGASCSVAEVTQAAEEALLILRADHANEPNGTPAGPAPGTKDAVDRSRNA